MGSYALKFPLEVASPDPLLRIQDAVAKIAAQTKISAGELRVFDTALQGLTKSGSSAAEALKLLAKGGELVTPAMQNLAKGVLQTEAALNSTTQAAVKMGRTLQSEVVPQITATSAAIRVLEGGMPIRAVENMLSKVLGLGGAFQMAFPIFGAVAMVEVIGRMVGKIGELYDAWDPVNQAEERSLKILQEVGKELEKQANKRKENRYRDIEMTAGPAARARTEAGDILIDDVPKSEAKIRSFDQRESDLRKQLAEARSAQAQILSQHTEESAGASDVYAKQAEAAQIQLATITAQRLVEQDNLSDLKERAGTFIDTAKRDDKRTADEAARKAEEAKRRADEQARKMLSLRTEANEYVTRSATGHESYVTQSRDEQARAGALAGRLYEAAREQKPGADRDALMARASSVYSAGGARAADIYASGKSKESDANSEREKSFGDSLLPAGARREENETTTAAFYRQTDESGKAYMESQKLAAEGFKKQYDTSEKIAEIQRQMTDRISGTQTSLAISQLPLMGLSGESLIRARGGLELGAAKGQFDRDMSSVSRDKEMTEEQRSIESAKKVADYKAKEAEIQAKMVEDLDQARQRQSDQISSSVSGGAMSLLEGVLRRAPGQHQSHGTAIEQLARSGAEDLIGTMVGNISKMVIMNPQGGGLANIVPNLHGTALEGLVKGNAFLDRIPGAAAVASGTDSMGRPSSVSGLVNSIPGGSKTGADAYTAPVNTFQAAVDKFAETVMSMTTGRDASGAPVFGGVTGAGGSTDDLSGVFNYISGGSPTAAGSGSSDDLSGVFKYISGGAASPASSTSAFSGSLSTGLKAIAGFGSMMASPFADRGGTPGVDGNPGKDLGRFSSESMVAAGADVAVGGLAAYQQFSRGGAKGALGGTTAILGTAAALSSALPPLAMALGVAAAFTGVVGSMLGDPKQLRQQGIANTLFSNQYIAPQSINVSSSTMGGYADIGANGTLRTSSLSPYPSVSQGYLDYPYRTEVPGRQTSQFGNGAAPVIHMSVNAMDASSFHSFLRANPAALSDGLTHALNSGQTSLNATLRRVSGRG